jgi:hypothetical protein
MRITIRSSGRDLDLTRAITGAVAHALWEHGGGNEVVNWLEAERFVATLARAMRIRAAGSRRGPGRVESRRAERVTGPIPFLHGPVRRHAPPE